MPNDMIAYYRQRASEYERIYAKPERQEDLRSVRTIVGAAFQGRHVLELSCGTGYWTEVIAPAALSVVACDINSAVLEIARGKDWRSYDVEFREADSYALPNFGREFSAAFAGFWWSHVPKRRLHSFLEGLHLKLQAGSKVVFVDNRYVEGSSTCISRLDAYGDSFQLRKLKDGSVHEVLKNFPAEEELLSRVEGVGASAEVTLTEYFWMLTYHLR